MKNVHPSEVLKCSATDINKALTWLLTETPTPKRIKAVKAASAMIHGHSERSMRYRIPAHICTSIGQFGYRTKESKRFKYFSAMCYTGRLMYTKEIKVMGKVLVKHYLNQLATYSDITKLKRLMENYNNAYK